MRDWNDSDFAVVIGINDYSDPRMALTSPAIDAQKITEWLTSDAGGRIPPENVKTLIGANGTQIDQNAIQDGLVAARAFSKEYSKINGLSAARRLYFYFSGHGLSENTEVLLCHSKWCDDWPNANLNSDKIEKNYINPCTYFDEAVFWLDCCRSSGTTYVSSGLDIGCALPRNGSQIQKTMLTYASLDKQPAYQWLEEEDECSLFTQVLLAALKYRGRHTDNKVSWRSVEKHLIEYVPALAERFNKEQTSYVEFRRTSSDDDPVFSEEALIPKIFINTNINHGDLSIKNSGLELVKEIEIINGKVSIDLKPGIYSASINGVSKPFQVTGLEADIYVEF